VVNSEGQADTAGEDELARIEAALDRLTGPAPDADRPLVEIAAGLDDLHQELQSALTGLDRS
jgi:hypothetical protein